MAQSVLIPLDGSPLAEQAVPLGVSVARQLDISIVLVRAVPPKSHLKRFSRGTQYTPQQLSDPLRSTADGYLQEMVRRVTEVAEVSVVTQTVAGNVGEAVVEAAENADAAYVVMTTHGRSGLARWALGSITDRVLRLATCALIVFRPRDGRAIELADLPTFERIVVPLDGSSLAELALDPAIQLAKAYSAKLLLFRVLLHPPPHLPEPQATAVLNAYQLTVGRETREYLADLVIRLSAQGLDVDYDVGVEPVAEAILDFADDVQADLIAMTSRTREGLGRTLLGSVTDRIVRAGQVPVLITKP